MSKQENNEDMITLIDENGNEQLFKELFTFDSDDYGKSYIFIYPAEQENDDSVDIQAYIMKITMDRTLFQLKMIRNGTWLKKY